MRLSVLTAVLLCSACLVQVSVGRRRDAHEEQANVESNSHRQKHQNSKESRHRSGRHRSHHGQRSLHEHSDLGLCTTGDPSEAISQGLEHRVGKRSYLPEIACTDNHEIEAVEAKVHCQPRPRVVSLPWPNDTTVHQMTPSHVEVDRCDGGCFHRKQSCLPTKTRKIKIPVLLAHCTIHSNKCDKICAEVEIEEHTECGCECKIKRHHCNTKQDYRKELCGCQCRDLSAVQACYESGRVWDPSKCMCRCPLSTLQECSSKFVFDFTNSCKCIPEESNAIGSQRTERSQTSIGGSSSKSSSSSSNEGSESEQSSLHAMLPNWEFLAIGGLLIFILLLMVITISLARHIHRLKHHIRRSTEVHAPGSTGGANGALIHAYATSPRSPAAGNGAAAHLT